MIRFGDALGRFSFNGRYTKTGEAKDLVTADHSKLGVTAAHLLCARGELNLLITAAGAADGAIARCLKHGIEARRV